MPYSEELAARIRAVLADRDGLTERKMFGGVGWMLGGNMACGTMGDDLLVRVAPDDGDKALEEPGVRLMEMGRRTMRGFIVVAAAHVAADDELARWIGRGAAHAQSLPPK
ncbi:MAG TPA: TfoX/Sxy family protein [Solirubrobacteraceae bacterium]|nr:TfoX/Sxy family protein [Solirubrobacteraceae bacterium]